jgi:hypothetical protein
VEQLLGEPVVTEHPAGAGFTPSIASVVVGASGRRLFVKEAPPESVVLASVTGALGPRFVGSAGRMAAYEVVDGGPVTRWEAADLPELVTVLRRMRERLDPSPLRGTTPYAEAFVPKLGAWQQPEPGRELPVDIPIPALAELESRWMPALAEGTALHHGDLRRDNFLGRPDGRLLIVDWTHLWTAPGWMDVVRLAPDVAACGHDPEWLLQQCWPDAPADAVNVALAGLAGRAWREWSQPGPAALRHMQREQGFHTLKWLEARLEDGRL